MARALGRLVLVLGVAVACDAGTDMATTSEPATPEAAVQEAVIRAMMPDGPTARAEVICLAVRPAGSAGPARAREDPSPEFTDRFRRSGTDVVGGSECGLESPEGRMIHTSSKRAAVLYSVGTPVLHGPDSAAVRAGWERGSLWGSYCRYGLVREGDRWRVVSCRDRIES